MSLYRGNHTSGEGLRITSSDKCIDIVVDEVTGSRGAREVDLRVIQADHITPHHLTQGSHGITLDNCIEVKVSNKKQHAARRVTICYKLPESYKLESRKYF